MSFTKSNIVNSIAKKTSLSNQSARQLLDKLIQVVVTESYVKNIKLSGFGSFQRKVTPSRVGRNPKTGEEFNISERSKLHLTVSNKVKQKLN